MRNQTAPDQNGGRDNPDGVGVDVLIAGAGQVGLSIGLALKFAIPQLEVVIVDPKGAVGGGEKMNGRDNRAIAIAGAARNMLTTLEVWSKLAPEACPITEMDITDSPLNAVLRPVFLTFSERLNDHKPLAHMVMIEALSEALENGAKSAGVKFIRPDRIETFDQQENAVLATMANSRPIAAKLLVACDGVNSKLRDLAGIETLKWSYDQMGIVATVQCEFPHQGRAIEHFLPAGPFAILPLNDNRASLVWSEQTDLANRLLAMDKITLQGEMARRFTSVFGHLSLIDHPRGYPLTLTLAKDFVAPRIALAGDAAHGIHPISGQGLNLGFKDAAALCEVLVNGVRRGDDIGGLNVLRQYQQWRRFDTWQMAVATDVLNRLFSNNLAPLRLLRQFGLGLVERFSPIKKCFINEAAGLTGDIPKLLTGKPI